MNFFTLLGILFIGLKLTGFITWSWWLVLLPIYGWVVLYTFIAIFAACGIASTSKSFQVGNRYGNRRR
jgi:hypothetical protein